MFLEEPQEQRTTAPRYDLRVVLAEMRAANLEIALSEMQSQRDIWRERAERLATAAQR